ncbi:MAG TPA: hypothetical protein VIL74_22135 [Pyrinomonadaceae bacterium]|jgi:hypothetical protein
MKKHIFGAALFSFIVAFFAFTYAFFYAPSIPSKEAVKPPLSRNEQPPAAPRTYCNLKRNKFTHEVLDSQLFVQDGKLVSKLKLRWNGNGEAPKLVFINARIFDINNPNSVSYIRSSTFRSNFNNLNEATVVFDEKFYYPSEAIKAKNNFYVLFDVSDQYSKENSLFDANKLPEAKPVLTVYEKSSPESFQPEAKPVLRGTSDIR